MRAPLMSFIVIGARRMMLSFFTIAPMCMTAICMLQTLSAWWDADVLAVVPDA